MFLASSIWWFFFSDFYDIGKNSWNYYDICLFKFEEGNWELCCLDHSDVDNIISRFVRVKAENNTFFIQGDWTNILFKLNVLFLN